MVQSFITTGLRCTWRVTFLALVTAGSVTAQVAGTTPPNGIDTQAGRTAYGWSAKDGILGRSLFNESGQKIGKVADLIVDPNRYVSYLMIGVGGVFGQPWHVVAVPSKSVRMQGERMVLPGATKASLSRLPPFKYVSITWSRSAIVASAEHDIDAAKRAVIRLEAAASGAGDAESQARAVQGIAELKRNQTAVEDKIEAMVHADAAHWQGLEAEVDKAATTLRGSMSNAPD